MICDSPSHEARFSYVRVFCIRLDVIVGIVLGCCARIAKKASFEDAAQHLGKAVSCFRNV